MMLLAALLFPMAAITRASMTIQSLTGAVTATEISSFKTFMSGQTPPSAQTYDNTIADGTAGMEAEALGLMYEVTNDPALLDQMIVFADDFISLRNDLTSAANGGQRVMWTGNIDPVWLTKAASSSEAGYAGCENNDIVGHIAYCAKLILLTPSLWNSTVPDGNPHGYGVTYYERATNYIAQMEYSEANYFNKYFINTSNDQITAPTSSAWTTFGESVNAWNRQMMFLNGWQRLSECHQILGDSPANVTFYNGIVQASINWFFDKSASGLTSLTTNGYPAYNWDYAPLSGGSEDLSLHADYDMWGLNRAFHSGIYTNLSESMMIPFGNTLQQVIYKGNNTFADWVSGDVADGSRNYIYPAWTLVADFAPEDYFITANANIAQGSQGSTAIFDAFILAVKNARYTGIFANNTNSADFSLSSPWIETVEIGGTANYPVTVNSLDGFGSGVTISFDNLPGGMSASVSPGYNATITLTASNSASPGIYSATISGTGGGITRMVPLTLVVVAVPNFSLSATPSSQNIVIGGDTSYTVMASSLDGFSGTVSLSVSGLPTGAGGSFSPASISGGSGSSTLNITTGTNTPDGDYPLTITGVSGTLTNTTSVTLSFNDFSISASPSSQSVAVGGSTNYTVNVGNINGFGGTVTFVASGLPTGASASFNPASVSMLGSSTMTLATAANTPAGTNTLTVTGDSGGLLHSATATLIVNAAPDFTLSTTPGSQTVAAGNSTNYTATVGALNGFSGNVTFSVSGLPSGASGSFSPTSVSGSGSSTLTITTTNTLHSSTNTLTITGTSGSLTHSNTVTLVINSAQTGALPAGWTDSDIGAVGVAGSAAYTNGVFTIQGSGADIFGTSDEFNYARETITNDFTLTARVATLNSANAWSKSGVMIRGSGSTNSAYVGVYVTTGNGVDIQCRTVNGASAVDMARVSGVAAPYWVRLVRSGTTFTGYCSPDGSTWTQVSSTNVTMAASVRSGLAVCAHDNTALNTSTFDNVAAQ